VDVTLYPTPRLLDAYEAVGQKWFTLAFITSDLRTREPAWGGVIPMWQQYFVDQASVGMDTAVAGGGGRQKPYVRCNAVVAAPEL
jgi:hypothetical protein